jgi:glycosyltransferase involved in cell wall biosynthesis
MKQNAPLVSDEPRALADQRVLVLHNRYRLPGGEERYAAQLTELLTRKAAHAELLERSSGDMGPLGAAAGLLRGGLHPSAVREAVKRSGASVVHAHNIHPAFGWRALAAARDAGAAVVLHLHNYRIFCAIGTVYRDGHDCTECAPKNQRAGFEHNCRGSRAESATYAVSLGRWQEQLIESVDRFVAPVPQLSDDLTELGFDLPLTVLPTWLPSSEFVVESQSGAGEYALFVGRVTEDKGALVAIEAAAESQVPLRIAGDGPDIRRAQQLAQQLSAPVEFLGRIDGQALVAARMGAAFALLPSKWREVLPFSALEALASGLPLLTSDRGGLPDLTEPQFVSPAGDSSALASQMRALFDDRGSREAAGRRALERAHERFSENVYAARLGELYVEAQVARNS